MRASPAKLALIPTAVDFTILWPIISTIFQSIPLAEYKASD